MISLWFFGYNNVIIYDYRESKVCDVIKVKHSTMYIVYTKRWLFSHLIQIELV